MRPFTEIAGSPLDGRCHVRRIDLRDDEDAASLANRVDVELPDADAILVSPWTWCVPHLSEERLASADRLRVIAGTFSHRFHEFLDLPAAARRGVTLVDTSRSMSPTVAEFGLTMILNLLRDIPTAIDLVRSGGWKTGETWDQPGFVQGDLAGKKVGLAGYGAIGRHLASLLAPFRCEITAFDPYVPDETLSQNGVARAIELNDLVADSEIVVISIPPLPGNARAVDAHVIDAIPAGALVVLLSRMAVVDQDALWRRAEAGEIRLAVDVYAPEPPPVDASFRRSRWVLPTPHIGGAATHCHRRCFTEACIDVLTVLDGGAPRYGVANPSP